MIARQKKPGKSCLLLISLCLVAFFSAPGSVNADDSRARGLLNALGCKGCHRLQGQGGLLAPELDRVGSRKTRDHLARLFVSSKLSGPAHDLSFLAETDRAALVDFLAELKQPPPTAIQSPPGSGHDNSP